jgi:hypothetical protein
VESFDGGHFFARFGDFDSIAYEHDPAVTSNQAWMGMDHHRCPYLGQYPKVDTIAVKEIQNAIVTEWL